MKRTFKRFAESLITTFSRATRSDLLYLAHKEIGIVRTGDFRASGEYGFVTKTLPLLFKTDTPIMADVGANKGEYSKFLKETFPKSRIMSFEPNPASFKILSSIEDIKAFNVGLSSSAREIEMYVDPNDPTTERASLHKDTLNNNPRAFAPSKIKLSTLDGLCAEQKISSIDFLKIDIEGHELEALKGARTLLSAGVIGAIQFEFSVIDIAARTFLRDFYELLPGYEFYRIHPRGLVHLGVYDPMNEIFRIHNVVALSKSTHDVRSVNAVLTSKGMLWNKRGLSIRS